jgi:hypothetical protein
MALTFTAVEHNLTQIGGRMNSAAPSGFRISGTITLDASYATGGEELTVAILNAAITSNLTVSAIDAVCLCNPLVQTTATNYFPSWDATNGKVMAFTAFGTEVTATTDLAAGAEPLAAIVYVTAS